jgi:hypothetical protein
MDIERLKTAWQKHSAATADWLSGSNLAATLDRRVRRLERQVFWRDIRETLAAMIGVIIFGLLAWYTASPVARTGAALTVVAAIFIVAHLHRTRARVSAPDPSLPLMAYCRRALDRVDGQIALLRSVLWWYILPLLIGCNLVFAGQAGLGVISLVYAALSLSFGVFVYRLNQRAVNKTLLPLREELEVCLRSVEANGETR